MSETSCSGISSEASVEQAGMDRIQPIRTYSDAWLDRHRQTHAQHAVFGTHRHPYLLETMRAIATRIADATGEKPSLLDYGCGKGVFLRELGHIGLFRYLRGYDPAVEA